MPIGGVDWTQILLALIAALPSIIAAVYAGKIHRQVQTPSGDSIGNVVERTHETSVANHLLVRRVVNGAGLVDELGNLPKPDPESGTA